MLKKFLIGSFVALALMVTSTAFASVDLGPTTLRVGSSGQYVMTLQTIVGVDKDGAYGPMTKAAVMAWQANNGLTPDGIVGPLTKAAMNATGTTITTTETLCPNGMTLASNCGALPTVVPPTETLCPNGMTLASNCSVAPNGTETSSTELTGTEGSIAVSYDGVPANSLAINKGESKVAMGIKIKATGSDMDVNRVWMSLDNNGTISPRIWLAANKATLLDGSTVLAEIELSASTVTELVAGTSYRLEFNGLNFVVPAGTTKVLTVKFSRPVLTTNSGTIIIPTAGLSVRAVDGTGLSEAQTISGTRTLNFPTTTAATGTLTNTLSSNTPDAQSVSGLSTTSGVTTPVKLMDFDLKATDGVVNTTSITGTLATTSGSTCTVAECVASVELRDGTTVLSSVTGATTLSFTSLDIDVADGATKTLSLWGIMNHIASSYVVAGDGITAAITGTTGTSGPSYTTASTSDTVTGNTQYLFKYAPTFALVNTATYPTSAKQVDESTSTTVTKSGDYKLSFSVTAPTGSAIYVDAPSTIQVQAYTASPTVPGASKLDTTHGGTLATSYEVSGTVSTGSTSGYDKVAAGQTRTFTVTGYIPHGGTAGDAGMRIAAIKWIATDAITGHTVQTWGISDLKTGKARVTVN